MKKKAIGHRGLWFAEVDGERLPCVHAHWWKGNGYNDPNARPGDNQFDELVDAIRSTGRVILTSDKVSDGGHSFQRTGYIAIFAVSDLEFDNDGLRFRFMSRLLDLE